MKTFFPIIKFIPTMKWVKFADGQFLWQINHRSYSILLEIVYRDNRRYKNNFSPNLLCFLLLVRLIRALFWKQSWALDDKEREYWGISIKLHWNLISFCISFFNDKLNLSFNLIFISLSLTIIFILFCCKYHVPNVLHDIQNKYKNLHKLYKILPTQRHSFLYSVLTNN